MQLLQRLFTKAPSGPDPRDSLRPLWHRVVEIARSPELYRDDGVADTVAGRFDMLTAVLSVVLLRMERDRVLGRESALLTELFVEDMDGQLRESGVGDVVVGKRMGRLMSVLGGRLGAYRSALGADGNAALEDALGRNVTMLEGHGPEALAARLRDLHRQLQEMATADLLAGRIER